MRLPGFLLKQQVTVRPLTGSGPYGPVYGSAVTVRCFLDEMTRLVREPSGGEVTSGATFYCQIDAVDAPPGSEVTLPDGRTTTVIEQRRHKGGGPATPHHLEVQLK